MRYLIVEPHADDALLCGLYCINNIKHEFTDLHTDITGLVTVTNSNPDGKFRDSKKYCKYMGYEFISNNNYIPQVFFRDCTNELKKYQRTLETVQDIKDSFFIYNFLYPNYYPLIKERIEKAVDTFMPTMIITCYGLLHATHVFTRHAVDEIASSRKTIQNVLYMLDIPYRTMTGMVEYSEEMRNYILSKEEVCEKMELFYKFYPSEKYFAEQYSNMFELPEIIYIRKNS